MGGAMLSSLGIRSTPPASTRSPFRPLRRGWSRRRALGRGGGLSSGARGLTSQAGGPEGAVGGGGERVLVSVPYPLWASPPVLGSGRRQGTVSAGIDAETPGAQGDNRLLPVPERGRGPGPSALQRAGLPEARGHPGAAQPVGEEDRAAQIGGGHTGRHGHPPQRWRVRHLARGHLCKAVGGTAWALPPCQSVFRVRAHRWP